ncbi:hypothetical protein GGI12_001302 [Dipsacomyces acuminosporus]|nr:hypothetical protein GGI12_001302 [Dipsacomyces acuminosporus]
MKPAGTMLRLAFRASTHAGRGIQIRLAHRSAISQDGKASAQIAEDKSTENKDARHEEFARSFVNILRSAQLDARQPLPVDEETQRADKQIAGSLAKLFSKSKVQVTPELLERREKLRKKYPELFRDIPDSELDR